MAKFGSKPITLKNGRALVLRSLEAKDFPAFAEFHAQVSRESVFTLQKPDLPPDATRKTGHWEHDLADPVALNLGAFVGEELVGTIGLHPFFGSHAWVKHIAHFGMMILKKYWGSGLAVAMLREIEDHARKHGIRRIEAYVREQNVRGVRLYEKMGFEIEGRRKLAAIIDGQPHDEFYIAKLL